MASSFTIVPSKHHGDLSLQLQGTCCSSADATHLVETVEQHLGRCASTLWLDCQHLLALDRCGQAAILQIERLAALARVVVYWQGFSEPVAQQLSETGLYLLLRQSPFARYGPSSTNEPISVALG